MQPYEKAADYLSKKTSFRPQVGIICGSGLSNLSKQLSQSVTINYENIPGFPLATVSGHTGELVFGFLGDDSLYYLTSILKRLFIYLFEGDVECVCMRGRFHFYEGNDMATVALPVRVMRLLGVKLLIVTNAAGGLNPNYKVGDLMIIQDHFGFPCMAGNGPLIGPNDDKIGSRFTSTSDAFDEVLQDIVLKVASDLGYLDSIRPDGTYCFVSGPGYESKAESRFLRSIGGDSVGMSTIPEVLAAKHCGMKILGLSLITNKVVVNKDDSVPASHAEVLAAVEKSGKKVEAIVGAFARQPELKLYLANLPPVTFSLPLHTTIKPAPLKDFELTLSISRSTALTLLTIAAAVAVSMIAAHARFQH